MKKVMSDEGRRRQEEISTNMNSNIAGKVVVITGASSELRAAAARLPCA